jgi:aspartyl-tRNA(Asn)/glutamyl-tRNA(Gln) amidotransferase subunit B
VSASSTAAGPLPDVELPAGMSARLMVGMEIHVELATRSKMFTSAPNVAHRDHFAAEPNSLLDPVVVGMPGTLPVINRAAVEMAMRVGLALGCDISPLTKWDRKSYYYPDLPKNYQISQYDLPLCGPGSLSIALTDAPDGPTKVVRITRAHLEEDAGKLLHEAPGGRPIDYSIVDLNRAGTPLLEIVTEPDIESADEAVIFGQALRRICRHLGVSEGVMQMGHMRFEPNINVVITHQGREYRTPVVEIKNLNSFKAVHGAITHEFTRQIEEWLETGRVMGERAKTTRGWDDVRGVTTLQRHKEDADEYRYFPDPDLVPLIVESAWIERLRAELPELPQVKQRRYLHEFGLDPRQVDQLIDEPKLCAMYEQVMAAGVSAKRAAALLLNYGAKRANERGCAIHELAITPAQIAEIEQLSAGGAISSNAADELFNHCIDAPDVPAGALAEKHGLVQVSDTGQLEAFVDQVIADPKLARAVADIRAGKDKAIGALLGQVMRLSQGKANPQVVTGIIKKKLQG